MTKPWIKNTIRTRWLTGIGLAGMLAASGCGRDGAATVTVGSKDFTEQFIVAEIVAQTIEARTDLNVRRRTNLGGTMICHNAMRQGSIDVYVEYTGTALRSILGKETASVDPNRIYDAVKEGYKRDFDLVWLAPFGFNNTYAMTVRRDFAEKHGLESIGDLEPMADTLTAGFTAEFAVREDGYPGLKMAYGFEFRSARDMDPSLMYRAVAGEQVDVICAFATDGRIAAYDLATLRDNRNFFPPYDAAPIARAEVLTQHPQLADALAALAGMIDDATMRQLNREVDAENREPAAVARDFLIAQGIIPVEEDRESQSQAVNSGP